MRIFIPEETEVWINGKKFVVPEGEQEVEDFIAEVLLHANLAKKIEKEETEKAKGKKQ